MKASNVSVIEIHAPPSGAICDFCSGRPVVFTYEAQDFETVESVMQSVGAWAACAECAKLVDDRNIEGLLDRVLAAPLFARMVRDAPGEHQSMLREKLKEDYYAFFLSKGAKTPYEENAKL